MATSPAVHASLSVADVVDLGEMLIEIADKYPLDFRTERDFSPLVAAYVRGRVPASTAEFRVDHGAIDFRFGGTNPCLLELAVAPRALADSHHPEQRFPGHSYATQLYSSQNRAELRKLAAIPQSRARKRFLLLLDLQNANSRAICDGYKAELPSNGKYHPVHVVYVSRKAHLDFTVGGKKRGRKPK